MGRHKGGCTNGVGLPFGVRRATAGPSDRPVLAPGLPARNPSLEAPLFDTENDPFASNGLRTKEKVNARERKGGIRVARH